MFSKADNLANVLSSVPCFISSTSYFSNVPALIRRLDEEDKAIPLGAFGELQIDFNYLVTLIEG